MTAPDVNADVRARFEAKFVGMWPLERASDGEYVDSCTDCRFEGYRAAHADLAGDPRSESGNSEEVAQWLYANGYREAAATIRTQLDVRNKRIADLSGEVRELVEAATEIADNTENWNRAVIKIIGRQPNTGIGTERLRAALAKFTNQETNNVLP